jgi:hypothetical protein
MLLSIPFSPVRPHVQSSQYHRMKKTLLLLSLASVLALPAAMHASLVLHYTFEEGAGSATADLAPASAAAGDNAGTLGCD